MNQLNQLNPRQQKFINYYLQCGIGKEAAIKAGYASKYADRHAYCLLQNPNVKSALDSYRERLEEKIENDLKERTNKVQLTFEYKLEVLQKGIDHYTQSGDFDKAAKLIEVSNKMQGHNATEKHQTNVTLNQSVHNMVRADNEYDKDF